MILCAVRAWARGHAMMALAGVMLVCAPVTALCAPELITACHVPDRHFPQLEKLWQPSWTLGTSDDDIPANTPLKLGGYFFVYVRNASSEPLTTTDLVYQGIKLSEGFGRSGDRQSAVDLPGHSIYLSKLPKEQIKALEDAGEPVWWKAEPRTIPPGGCGEIVLRLRRELPASGTAKIGLVTDHGDTQVEIDLGKQAPRFESISFHPKLTVAQIYICHAPNTKLEKLFLDDRDITADARIGTDSALGFTAAVYWPEKPFEPVSYHMVRAVFSDGSVAAAGIRAWGSDFVYGMWGAVGEPKAYYEDLARHNINAQMGHAAKQVTEMSLTSDGFEFLSRLGIRQMATWPGNARNPLFHFLMDEPDAHDPEIDELAKTVHLGCLAQGLVGRMELIRGKDAGVPILLNVDNTDTPYNWYTYHQLADVPSIDPYYPSELDTAYERKPGEFPRRFRPTYVYAASRISQFAGAPKPLHVILCSTKYVSKNWKPGDYMGRYPTPEEKRIEVYYAIAGGAKGMSYWWFSPDQECKGLGEKDAAAMALWKEIGLLGAEVRTAGAIITTSCPADLRIKAPGGLTARALVSGLETVGLVLVNDNIVCDRVGTVVKPVKGSVEVEAPAWMEPKDAFEITCEGIKDVTWTKDGKSVALELGPVSLTRFVLVTSDTKLKEQLKQTYQNKFAANVAALNAQR